jgi:hypothetical protein
MKISNHKHYPDYDCENVVYYGGGLKYLLSCEFSPEEMWYLMEQGFNKENKVDVYLALVDGIIEFVNGEDDYGCFPLYKSDVGYEKILDQFPDHVKKKIKVYQLLK